MTLIIAAIEKLNPLLNRMQMTHTFSSNHSKEDRKHENFFSPQEASLLRITDASKQGRVLGQVVSAEYMCRYVPANGDSLAVPIKFHSAVGRYLLQSQSQH
jgi:hypothetical protein